MTTTTLNLHDISFGNYLMDENGVWAEVKGLSEDGIDVLMEDEDGDPTDMTFNIDELFGIPLTEEVLKKVDLASGDGGLLQLNSFVIKAGTDLYGVKDRWQVLYQDRRIEYLHHLQNLCHAVSHQELDIDHP